MRKQIFLFVLFVILGTQFGFSQNFVVKGNVISGEDKEPLIGVSVSQAGSALGVITDYDGNYTINLDGTTDATLVFSYIGMKPQEHRVTAKTGTLNVVLEPNSEMIDEVVVVAYGVRKKGTIAGSVSTVKAEKMENVPAASFDQALQGQLQV